MGFHVSTLHNLPVGRIRYFVHVIDISSGLHSHWIDENLSFLADSLGPDAGLVTGPANVSSEIYEFLSHNLASRFCEIESLLHSTTCLLVSEGHLTTTESKIYLIPISTNDESEDAKEFVQTILNSLAEALKRNELQQFLSKLGAQELELQNHRENFFVCTLRCLNEIVVLKPNIAGLGLDLNAAIERLLPSEQRSI